MVAAVKAAEAAGVQVVAVSTLGHKCDAAFMAMHEDWRELRALQTGLQRAGLEVVDSYVSLTEVSEYADGHARGDAEGSPVPDDPAAAAPHAGVVLLPDVEEARRPTPTGSRCRSTSARN